jgi:Fe-S-cluster containining protein
MRVRRPPKDDRWATSSERAELLAIYRAADALFDGWTCACAPGDAANHAVCCHFGLTGREPCASAAELAEIHFVLRATGIALRNPCEITPGCRRLPNATDDRRCPLLSRDGRCRIYGSRPFGCRTFFCIRAAGPLGAPPKLPRNELRDLGGRIATLSAHVAPLDPRPRTFVRALLDRNA